MKIKARWRTISTTFRRPVNEEIGIFFLLMGPLWTLLIFLSSLRKSGCGFLRQHTFIQVRPCSPIFLLPPKFYCFFLVESDSIPMSLFVIADLDSSDGLELIREALDSLVRGFLKSVVIPLCLCLLLAHVDAWLKNSHFIHPQS